MNEVNELKNIVENVLSTEDCLTKEEYQKLVSDVTEHLDYIMLKDILVKPMPVTMVTRDVQRPKATGETDENGADIYDGVEVVSEEFESIFRVGIVLSVPSDVQVSFSVGDEIVFPVRAAAYFELFKDSMLVKPYDVVAKLKPRRK